MPQQLNPRKIKPLSERIAAKSVFDPETGCLQWIGGKTSFGHGITSQGGKNNRIRLMAHRAAWELQHGTIPAGMCVLHRCDNPSCVNTAHLFLGTKADNSADMTRKGRQKYGEALPQTRLTKAQVDAIRKCSAISQREIASLCGV